jgi:hypothetical protein
MGDRGTLLPFICDGLYRAHLAEGETVISLPLGYGTGAQAMLWQAQSGMYFRLGDGYLAIAPPSVTDWPVVKASLQGVELVDESDQFLAYAASRKASVVMVPDRWEIGAFEAVRAMHMLEKLRPPKLNAGGMVLYQLPLVALTLWRGVTPVQMEFIENEDRFRALLLAAYKYLVDGGDASKLSLGAAAQKGLIPTAWTTQAMRTSSYATILEFTDDGRIGVGLKCGYPAVVALTKKYGTFARSVYYPYPYPLKAAQPRREQGVQFLEMVFERDGLKRATLKSAEKTP